MKRKLLFVVFFSLFLFAFLSVCTFAETEPQTSPYGLYVAGVAVTEENASDIFSDGSAIYDASKNVLTLNGFNKTGVSTINFEGVLLDFSIYAEKDTGIKITGKDNVFYNTVCAVGGDISIDSAEISFMGEGNSFLRCVLNAQTQKSGDILFYNSQISVLGFESSIYNRFEAKNVIFQNTDFKMTFKEKEGPFLSSLSYGLHKETKNLTTSLFYADAELRLIETHFLIETPFPYVTYLFFGGKIVCENSVMDICGAQNVFGAEERNACDGSLVLKETNVSVADTHYLAATVSAEIEKSDLKASLYYGGIRVVQTSGKPSMVVANSSLTINNLSFSQMEKQCEKIWNAMYTPSKAAHSNDYSRYLAYTRDTSYPTSFAQGYGVLVFGGNASFEKSTLVCEGFRTALYLQYAVTLALGKGVSLDLKATEAAFIMASSYEDALSLPTRVRTRFSSVFQAPANPAFTDDCAHLYGAAQKKLTLDESIKSTDLLDLLTGEATQIRIRTAPFVPLWVSLVIVGVLTSAVLGVGVVYIIKEPHARKRANKKHE